MGSFLPFKTFPNSETTDRYAGTKQPNAARARAEAAAEARQQQLIHIQIFKCSAQWLQSTWNRKSANQKRNNSHGCP